MHIEENTTIANNLHPRWRHCALFPTSFPPRSGKLLLLGQMLPPPGGEIFKLSHPLAQCPKFELIADYQSGFNIEL